MANKLMICHRCNLAYHNMEQVCMHCGNALTPEPEPPKKKKTALIVLVSVLGVALIAGVVAAWWMELGPFHINLKGTTPLTMAQIEGGVLPPTDKEREQFAKFVNKLADRSEIKLKKDEKEAVVAIQELVDFMGNGGLHHLAASITPATHGQRTATYTLPGLSTAMQAASYPHISASSSYPHISSSDANTGGLAFLPNADINAPLSFAFLGATDPTATPDPSEAIKAVLGELMETAQNAEAPPPRAPHGNWPTLRAPQTDGSAICESCKHKNPPEATVCEKCGTLLTQQGLTATLPAVETPPILDQVPEDERPSYNAETLNTIACQLYTEGYFRMPLYLAALAAAEDPDCVDAINTIATLLKGSEEFENALLVADHGLKIQPNHEALLYTAGMAALRLNEVDRAAAYFSRCLTATGGLGLANQGMMMVALARQDFGGAFLYMIEGGRDCFTSNVMEVYKRFKLRPDYKELSGKIFDQYTLMELMNFTRNRTAFDPSLDTVGQQLNLDRMALPSAIADWHASGPDMFIDCVNTMKGYALHFAEDAKMVAEVYDILFSAQDLEGLLRGFQASSLMPRKLTEMEEMISYDQEVFWLSILNDYFNWEISKIEAKKDAAMAASEYKDVMEIIDSEMKKSEEYVESFDKMSDMAALVAGLQYFQNTVIANHSPMFTKAQSAVIMPQIDGAIRDYSVATNEAYEKTRVLCEEYWCYSNAILGLISDDAIYNEWRQEQRYQVLLNTGLYVMEAGMWSGTVCFTYGFIPMLGQGSIGGSITSYIPEAPVLPITGKGATPQALMYGDILVPNIDAITKQVLGTSQTDIEKAVGKDIDWDNFREGNEDFDRWFDGLNELEKQKWTAYRADPSLVRASFIIDSTGQIGVNYAPAKGSLSEITYTAGLGLVQEETPPAFMAGYGLITVTGDFEKENYSITVGPVGLERTPEATTVLFGPSATLGAEVETAAGSGLFAGFSANASTQVYGTVNNKTGQVTSGGLKAGVHARIGSALGVFASGNLGTNAVTGLSTYEIGVLWMGERYAVDASWAF